MSVMSGPSRRTRVSDTVVRWVCAVAVVVPIAVVAVLLGRLGHLMMTAGQHAGEVASLVLASASISGASVALALPVAVAAAIHLEEYGQHGRLGRALDLGITQLAAVPSVLYGLLALELLVRGLGVQSRLLVAIAALAGLIAPILTVGVRGALQGVSPKQREVGLALGGTRWQVVRHVVLPSALPGIVAAVLRSLARAIGEVAPLLVIGAAVGLPVQLFEWLTVGEPARAAVAAGALLLVSLFLYALSWLVPGRGTTA